MDDTTGYSAQARGGLAAYERYLAGMDSSMRQKVALTAAHLLCEGRIADMGMGSGQGSHALAALYPRLQVVGVDIDATMVELARQRYQLGNLTFVAGDIGQPVFPPGSVDGIFDSSVLHHVTSFGGYRHDNAADALAAQVAELKPNGVLVVRDFVDPGPGMVWLELPADDGDDSQDPRRCSTAALFERFACEFRPLSPRPGFPIEFLPPPPRAGWRRYRLAHKHAAEFILRKDYRADWESEAKEEYTYFTQAQFEALFARLGLRVLASTPLRNPWIVRHRFRDRFVLRAESGATLDVPATNYVIVGEKVAAGEGVAFRTGAAQPAGGFLRMEHHRQRATGQIFDLAARPSPTIDIVPFFEQAGLVYVLARTSYPRPILLAAAAAIDGSRSGGYVAEPLSVIQADRPIGETVTERLRQAAGIEPARIRRMLPGTTYYPSPGGTMEEVRSMLVEVEPSFTNVPLAAVSGFSTSGRVRAIEACQLLRAAQVGGLPDARLELNVYDLLHRLGRPLGPWIGDEVRVPESPGTGAGIVATPLDALLARAGRRVFERSDRSADFLRIECRIFDELDAGGAVLASRALELVVPQKLSANTVSVALLARVDGQTLLAVDEDDLPAAQGFSGNSDLLVTPAWRLPADITTTPAARAWITERLAADYGVTVADVADLGGAYRPSPGLTPETVFPLAVVVAAVSPGKLPLRWAPLAALVARRAELPDGHLRVAVHRAAHAVGDG